MKDATSRTYRSDLVRQMSIFEVNYVFDKATDKKDAYMAAWANCMDMLK